MRDKIKFIKELSESMNENKIESVKYEDNNFEVFLTKKRKERNVIFNSPAVQPVPATNIPQEVEIKETTPVEALPAAPEEISGTKIISPMVGTFYASPSPTADPFVKEGDSVAEGQTLCIVEAMKLMNEVKSDVRGKIVKVLGETGKAVKQGDKLFLIDTNI